MFHNKIYEYTAIKHSRYVLICTTNFTKNIEKVMIYSLILLKRKYGFSYENIRPFGRRNVPIS